MVEFEKNFIRIIKVVTYIVLCSLIFISFYYLNYIINNEIILMSVILCGYTIVFSLPIYKFKMGMSGFEAELNRLVEEKPDLLESLEDQETKAEYEEPIDKGVEPNVVVMKLSVDIETTLRRIAEASGVTRTHVSMGQLISELQRKKIITDNWLLNSLHFFREHRNEVIHEGKKENLEKTIDIGIMIVAQLRDIENKIKM